MVIKANKIVQEKIQKGKLKCKITVYPFNILLMWTFNLKHLHVSKIDLNLVHYRPHHEEEIYGPLRQLISLLCSALAIRKKSTSDDLL